MPNASVVDLLPHPQRLTLSEVIGAFSYALDMGEGHVPGHSLRCCWLGSKIGKSLALHSNELWDLYYILLLKNIGGTSISSRLALLFDNDEKIIKHGLKILNTDNFFDGIKFIISNTSVNRSFMTRVAKMLPLFINGKYYLNELIRNQSERGADLVIQLGFNDNVADGIHCLNEHWDGNGHADGIKDDVIPVSSQIALLSEIFDVYYCDFGFDKAIAELKSRCSSWFNPDVLKMALDIFSIDKNKDIYQSFKSESALKEQVYALEPNAMSVTVDDERLDDIATAFAQVVDSKSPYNNGHSTRVALYSDAIANELGLSVGRRRWLYRGALLHDLGNMGLSNLILDTHDELTKAERQELILHARNTFNLLSHIQSFKELAKVASYHHERLDGNGYPRGLTEARLSLETRIITVANMFDALMVDRANSKAMPLANVLLVMEKQCDSNIDRDCFIALKKRIPIFFQD